MTPSAQPPEETFCLNCGPDVALERRGGATIHCPRCGISEPVPDFPLFVVTGASDRPAWRGTSTEEAIARHQPFAAWLRAHIQPCYDTSQLTPDETAERIATLRSTLSSTFNRRVDK